MMAIKQADEAKKSDDGQKLQAAVDALDQAKATLQGLWDSSPASL